MPVDVNKEHLHQRETRATQTVFKKSNSVTWTFKLPMRRLVHSLDCISSMGGGERYHVLPVCEVVNIALDKNMYEMNLK